MPDSVEIKNIIIVDDDDDIRKYLTKVMEAASFNVFPCSSGKQLIELLKPDGVKIDLILLDLSMPDMNGLEVLKLIQPIKKAKCFKVCVISGYNDKKVIIKANELGADDYLTKPFDKELLLTRVKSLLEQQKVNSLEQIFIKSNFTASLLKSNIILDFNIVEMSENGIVFESIVNFKETAVVTFISKPLVASIHCEEELSVKVVKSRLDNKNKFIILGLFTEISEQAVQSIKNFLDKHGKTGNSIMPK